MKAKDFETAEGTASNIGLVYKFHQFVFLSQKPKKCLMYKTWTLGRFRLRLRIKLN